MMYKENLKDADRTAILASLGRRNVDGQAMYEIQQSLERKDGKEFNYFLKHRISKEEALGL